MVRTFSLLLALALPATHALGGIPPNDDMFDKFAVLRAPPNEDNVPSVVGPKYPSRGVDVIYL